MTTKTRRKLIQFEENASAACQTCRKVALEAVETLLLVMGLYEFIRFTFMR